MDTRVKTGHTVIVNEIQWERKRLDELKPIFEVILQVKGGEYQGESTFFVQWTGKPNRFNFRFVERTPSQSWIRTPVGQQNSLNIDLHVLSTRIKGFFHIQRIGSDTLPLPLKMRLDGGMMIASLNKVVYWDGTEIQ